MGWMKVQIGVTERYARPLLRPRKGSNGRKRGDREEKRGRNRATAKRPGSVLRERGRTAQTIQKEKTREKIKSGPIVLGGEKLWRNSRDLSPPRGNFPKRGGEEPAQKKRKGVHRVEGRIASLRGLAMPEKESGERKKRKRKKSGGKKRGCSLYPLERKDGRKLITTAGETPCT